MRCHRPHNLPKIAHKYRSRTLILCLIRCLDSIPMTFCISYYQSVFDWIPLLSILKNQHLFYSWNLRFVGNKAYPYTQVSSSKSCSISSRPWENINTSPPLSPSSKIFSFPNYATKASSACLGSNNLFLSNMISCLFFVEPTFAQHVKQQHPS